jgi:uncharacterized protein with gpF-like domain
MNSQLTADSVITRLKQLFNVKTDQKLGENLTVSKTTISTWRQRNSVPYSLCIQLAQEKNLSLDWLLTGEGQMFRAGNNDDMSLNREEKDFIKMIRSMNEEQKKDAYETAEKFVRWNEMAVQQGLNAKRIAQ